MTISIEIINHDDICIGRKTSINRDEQLPTHKIFVKKYPHISYVLNFDNYKYFNVIKFVDTRSDTEYKIKRYLIDNTYMYSVDDILHSFKPNDNNVLTSFFDSQNFKDILKHYNEKYTADEDIDNDIQEIIDCLKTNNQSVFLYKFMYFNTQIRLNIDNKYLADFDDGVSLTNIFDDTIANKQVINLFLQHIDFNLFLLFNDTLNEHYSVREMKMNYRYIPNSKEFNWEVKLYRINNFWLTHEEERVVKTKKEKDVKMKKEKVLVYDYNCGNTYVLTYEKNTNRDTTPIKDHIKNFDPNSPPKPLCILKNLPSGIVFTSYAKTKIKDILITNNGIKYDTRSYVEIPVKNNRSNNGENNKQEIKKYYYSQNSVVIGTKLDPERQQVIDNEIVNKMHELINTLHWNLCIKKDDLDIKICNWDYEYFKKAVENYPRLIEPQKTKYDKYLDRFIKYDTVQKYFIFYSQKQSEVISKDQLLHYLLHNINKNQNLVEDYINSILQIAESI